MELKNLIVEIDNKTAVVQINRPQVLNAMNSETMLEIESLMHQLNENNEVRVIIITGEGKAFIAGADIQELSTFNSLEAREFGKLGRRVLSYIENMEKPVIAAINGYAFGGGCELALACDIRIAGERAKFGQPELKLGIIPGWAGTQRLSRLVGMGKAKEIIFTGDPLNASEALRIGLVNKVVPDENLMDEAKKFAEKMLQTGPTALKLVKTVMNRGLDSNFTTGESYESEVFGICFSTPDVKEGIDAFLNKRKPKWE